MGREVDVLVVGGGQAALAVGYYLQRARRPGAATRTISLRLPRAGSGGAWADGWDSLQLFSPAGFSSLPGWPMPAWSGQGNPSAEHVRAYLDAYEARYRLPVHRPVRAIGTSQTPGGFEVTTDHGVWGCRVLVSATGSWGRPFVPSYPGQSEFRGRQLHTVSYRSAADFEGKTVLVVGGGNSGAQIAADLTGRRLGRTVWVTQRPRRFLPEDVDGRKLFELATRRVRAAAAGEQEQEQEPGVGGLGDIVMVPPVLAARRRGDLDAEPMFDRLTPSGVAWDEPAHELEANAVVWCTGFRPDLRHLAGLALTRRDGLPATDAGLTSRSLDDPRLFFVGYGDWCGPASATLIGVGATARSTVDAAINLLAGSAVGGDGGGSVRDH